jgi:hypothetical protein
MLRRVALVRTYVSEELSASIILVTKICELGTMFAITSNRRTLRRNTNKKYKKKYKEIQIQKYVVFLQSVRRLLGTANVIPS